MNVFRTVKFECVLSFGGVWFIDKIKGGVEEGCVKFYSVWYLRISLSG